MTTDLEVRLREGFLRHALLAEEDNPARAAQVRARVRRNSVRRRGAVTIAVGMVAGCVLAGTLLSGRDSRGSVAEDPAVKDPAAPHTVAQLLAGAPVPADFSAAPLEPLASLLTEDRVAAVTGAAEAVACAWTSRYAADPDSPAAKEAREVLSLSDDWVMLQAIAGDNDYPSRVSTIAADIRREDLRSNWHSYLRCTGFPGNTNLA